MVSTQAATRHQQKVEELCAASIRALCGDADLHFRGQRLFRGRQALPPFAPHLRPSPQTDDFGSFRGAADAVALRLRHSDAGLHRSLCPAEPLPRMLFELLEQFRVEALAPADMPGMVFNLRHRFEQWSLAFHHSGMTETARGILIYTVAQMCRARVTAQPVVEATEDLIEATRMAIAPALGHALVGLRRSKDSQPDYAPHALAIAQTVASLLQGVDESGEESKEGADEEVDGKLSRFSLWMDFEADDGDAIATAGAGSKRGLEGSEADYRIFSSAYDSEIRAASKVRPALLREFRERLDQRIAGQGIHVSRLARDLKALLAAPTRDGWEGDQEEGHIDGRLLARLIVSPAERRLFRVERQEPLANYQVSFLIDCSGSMREHIESVAMLVDVFVRALDQVGVASEVLGFTTGAWNGGRARRDWIRAGQTPRPGRLNELCHMVFKDADTTWRSARSDIAALLKADLFREGIDGEAVDWACERMLGRDEDRRILIVVSDGSPTDSATGLANGAQYLDHHLCQVVARREQEGQVAICGVGVGLDLSPYYRHCAALDLSASVTNTVFRDIVAMIASSLRR